MEKKTLPIQVYYYILADKLRMPFVLAFGAGIIGVFVWSINPLIGFLYPFLGILVPFGLIIGVINYLKYQRINYRSDERNIYMQSGLLSNTETSLPIEKIDSVTFFQPFFGQVFGVGHLVIVSREVTATTPAMDKQTADKLQGVVKNRK